MGGERHGITHKQFLVALELGRHLRWRDGFRLVRLERVDSEIVGRRSHLLL